ncbi:MAG: S46 family peptidase, partial [Cyclobacteriaceae bacterium]
KPAPFNETNIPFKPRHHFPISLKGIAQGVFTMVFGYPGSIEQYLHARALEDLLENVDPHRIALRKVRLEILDMAMQENSEIKIQYTSKYARIANYYKKWIGERWGLTKFGALQSKYGEEAQFAKWASKGKRKKEYGSLMQDFHAIYDQREGLTQVQNYRMEAILGIEIMQLANQLTKLEAIPESGPQRDRVLQALKNYAEKFFKDYHAPTDKKVFEALLTAYQKNIHEDFQTTEIRTPAKEFTELFDASILTNEAEILKIVEDPSEENLSILLNDEVYSMYKEFELMYEHSVAPGIKETNLELEKLYRKYVTGLREMHKRKSFYPDANSTLRISYGIVDGYQPLDAVSYRYYTTIDGIMEKYVADDKDFDLPEKIIELYDTKEYGRYITSDGDLPVCFIASNHTTGGNSGSPVLNADGHLIGINFDRSWESTMSDYHYDPAICRNIAVDTRYILFIIDKYAGAGYLLEEMTIIK